ncbi:hypothetical protein [Nocardia sp. NPDC127526]|uniref:hypothetical protein n=1 Tax=Nocardia sp. NPDC127526 TaxID=3345393 RepID=UPI003625404C
MSEYRTTIMRSMIAAGVIAAGGVLAGCGDGDVDVPRTPTIDLTAPGTPTRDTGDDQDMVTPAAAQQLCDMISAEIGNWRGQGSALAKVSFNGTVQNWAARNEGLNDEVIQNKTIVDAATSGTCPDVRGQALEVLEAPDLASALAGFGN